MTDSLEETMTRSDKPLGDLEYEKFDGDGNLKTIEQSPAEHALHNRKVLDLLNEISEKLDVQTSYLRAFFEGDILDGSN